LTQDYGESVVQYCRFAMNTKAAISQALETTSARNLAGWPLSKIVPAFVKIIIFTSAP